MRAAVEVVTTAAAEIDYERALLWYDDRGAAERYAADFTRARTFLADFPEAGTDCGEGYRYFAFRRFPYGVIYRSVDNRVVIAAVSHNRQLPGFWIGRS